MILKGLSLFANVGIAEMYLKDIGIDIVIANELLPERAKFYNHLHNSDIICGDITSEKIYTEVIQKAKEKQVNFIIATPPCQGMSIAGHMNELDPRNTLIIKAMDALKDIMPEAMLIENVPQMFKTNIIINHAVINIQSYIEKICNDLGYIVKFNIFDAADYGTAQNRKRSFTRIYKKEYQWNDPIKQNWITVKEMIGDLPSLEANEKSDFHPYHYAKKHSDNHILWMKHTPTGKTAFENIVHFPKKDGRRIKGYSTTYKRIRWDKPAPTITMSNGSISSQNNVHPGRLLQDGTYSDARVLTLLEIFRLTGLKDNWTPPSWATEKLIREVIGEAIPPNLVKNILNGLSKI